MRKQMMIAATGRLALGFALPGMSAVAYKGPVFNAPDEVGAALADVKKAVDDGNRAFNEFKQKNDERLKEIEAKGFDDVVRRDELERINTAIDTAQKANDQFAARLKRISLYGNPDTDSQSAEERQEKAFRWWAAREHAKGIKRVSRDDFTDEAQEQVSAYKHAFEAYVRHNGDERSMSPEQLKALSVGSDPDGGYVVDADTGGRIVSRIFESSPMRQYASVQSIGTDALEGLHDNDEAGFGWVGETGARTETTSPKLEKWRIPVHEMYAKPAATQKLLDDALINMEAWLQGKVSSRFARAENAAFVDGNGVDRPRGFLSYPDRQSADTFELNAIERFNTGVNGGFAAAPNGGDVLIDALYGLKAQYRNNATWFMNRKTTGTVRQLKDSDGAYLWAMGIAAGQPATLLGYPSASFEDMPNIATGSLSMAVGDMREAYQIVDRMGVRVLRDPFSNKPFVEFYSTKRTGGDMVNFEALKLVEFST
jgi:HK97 family phage major capsid protein